METIAEKAQRLGRKCQQCGWEWIKKPRAPEPKRCPNHECRSQRWAEIIHRNGETNLEPFND